MQLYFLAQLNNLDLDTIGLCFIDLLIGMSCEDSKNIRFQNMGHRYTIFIISSEDKVLE